MIRFKTGDMFMADAEALVNTVNCVGVMGRGIALQFKRAFPANYKAYAARCRQGEMKPGRVFVFETGSSVPPRYIINFPSKRHWRGKSRLEDIESGLLSLVKEIRGRKILSVAIPPLGSGLGGLDWSLVRPRILEAFRDLEDVDVTVFEPGGGPVDSRANRSSEVPRMTPGRAALVGLLDRYLRGLLDPFVTLQEAHKLMYFMQEAGEPLRLRFSKGYYGPYADNLRHVLHAVEGHMVSGYADGGDRPDKRLTLVPGAIEDAHRFVASTTDTRRRFARVAILVTGFESPFGLELLSTVHWVATREDAGSVEDVVKQAHDWNERKQAFTLRQIALAHDVLGEQGWLTDGSAPHVSVKPSVEAD